jgi:AsmA protein
MPKIIKYVAITISALVGVLLIVVGIVAATFNPNDYKPLLIRLVQEKKQRSLAIPGDIKLTFFPKIGADLGQVAISEHHNPAEFASVKSAKVSLALIPLLSKQLVVDRIKIDGISVNLKRFKDGATNFDDLLGKEESGQKIKFDIDSVSIADAHIRYDDQQQGRLLEIAHLVLETGRIASGAASDLKLSADIKGSKPTLDAKLSVKSGFQFDLEKKYGMLKDLNLTLDVRQGAAAHQFKADGSAHLDLSKQSAALALKGGIDGGNFDARFGLSKFTPAAYTFDVTIDRLDADRYRSEPTAASTAAASTAQQPVDLSALKDLNAAGTLKIGTLKVANIKLVNVQLALHADGGKTDINPIAAELYGGKMSGAVSIQASSPPRFSVHQNLTGIDIGPLLKDALAQNQLEGKGNVQADIETRGTNLAQMKKNLNGAAKLELHDGSLRGINIAQSIRTAKARLDELRGGRPAQNGTGSSVEKTDFSELAGSFRIANGIAHNEDLAAKSPLLRLGGEGDIDLAGARLDYLVKASVVSTLQGQGGAELQSLKGVTVPVKLSGPFNAIGWNIDFASMAGQLAKQKVDEKKEELKSKAQQALDEQKNKLQEQLKGLLGK